MLILNWEAPVQSGGISKNFLNMGIIGLTPYAYIDDAGREKGYLVEITRKIRAEVNLPGDDEILPPKRLTRDLDTGSIDCTIVARVPFSERRYDMLAPIGKEIETVLLPRAGIKITSFDNLKDLKIAIPRGINLDERVSKNKSLDILITNGYRQSALLLRRQRVDAILGVWDSYVFNLRQIGMRRQDIGTRFVLNRAPIWLMCRSDFQNQNVKNLLIKVTNEFRNKGSFKKIIANYLGHHD